LLLDKLPEVLNEDQKMDKIHNLVSSLSGKRIRNIGSRRASQWVLVEDDKQ
jgi:ATP-dependent DNA helicase RecG